MIKNKVGIVVDSSCGLTKKEAEENGLYFVPIIIDYEGNEYESGVNIDNEFLWKNLTKESNAKTAAVKPLTLREKITKAAEENEKVYVFTLSHHLSSINDSAKLIAKDFKNVIVLDSEMVTPWSNIIIYDVIRALKNQDEFKVKKILTSQDGNMFGYILPKTMDSLYAGGRVTKAQYLIGSIAKINPIIPVINGSLSNHPAQKARGAEKARKKVVKIILDKRKVFEKKGIITSIFVAKTNDVESYNKMVEELRRSGYEGKINETKISPSITVHVGEGAVAIGLVTEY